MPSRETVSLYYRSGTSDKIYNIQLEPDGAGNWLVNAQYGRRTGGLTSLTKTPTAVPHFSAKRIYDDLVDEKKKKGYSSGALSGKSLPSAAAPTPAPVKVALPALPTWDGFVEFYGEVATALGVPSKLKTDPQPHLVLLADMASAMQDGVVDAIACARRLASDNDLRNSLSKEGLEWLQALPASLQSSMVATLKSACR